MREEFIPIELIQTFPDLLPEPHVVVQVTLNKLFDVFVRTALILSCHSIDFCLQFGAELYFQGCLGVLKADGN